jgi:hypothetical protein
MSKPKIIKDYEKLPEEVVEQIKLVYPLGFSQHLISFYNKDGEKKMGLPFETEDYYYLVRMTTAKARDIIENDDDYDDDGMLKKSVKRQYEDKYEDLDFLDDLNSNDDNDLGLDLLVDPLSEEDDDDDDI